MCCLSANNFLLGGLPFHYHVGPGPATVSMFLTVNATRRTGYNIVSKVCLLCRFVSCFFFGFMLLFFLQIPGEGPLSNEVVALGCHMDAWVMGASDPLSGQAVMIEVVRFDVLCFRLINFFFCLVCSLLV
jgi:hypothetical protein